MIQPIDCSFGFCAVLFIGAVFLKLQTIQQRDKVELLEAKLNAQNETILELRRQVQDRAIENLQSDMKEIRSAIFKR